MNMQRIEVFHRTLRLVVSKYIVPRKFKNGGESCVRFVLDCPVEGRIWTDTHKRDQTYDGILNITEEIWRRVTLVDARDTAEFRTDLANFQSLVAASGIFNQTDVPVLSARAAERRRVWRNRMRNDTYYHGMNAALWGAEWTALTDFQRRLLGADCRRIQNDATEPDTSATKRGACELLRDRVGKGNLASYAECLEIAHVQGRLVLPPVD